MDCCVVCGSCFELQKHHDKDRHKNRHDPNKDPHTIFLCATCHSLEHFDQDLKLHDKGIMKHYEKKMRDLEKGTYYAQQLHGYYQQCWKLKKELGGMNDETF